MFSWHVKCCYGCCLLLLGFLSTNFITKATWFAIWQQQVLFLATVYLQYIGSVCVLFGVEYLVDGVLDGIVIEDSLFFVSAICSQAVRNKLLRVYLVYPCLMK